MARKSGKERVTLTGTEVSQQNAEKALPILVRQAQAGQKITYEDLAGELNSPTARLGRTLGIIGFALKKLSKVWKEEIPPIQALVINKNTGISGRGIGYFIHKRYTEGTTAVRRQIVDEMDLYGKIFSYEKWPLVLKELGLKPVDALSVAVKETAHKGNERGYGSGGESKEHKELKERIAKHPELVKLKGFGKGETEHIFPSMDTIDVYFSNKKKVVGVEVKSIKSNDDDITRGLFQCKKYEALIEAEDKIEGIRRDIKVILALGGEFPSGLRPNRNVLSVNVIDNIR